MKSLLSFLCLVVVSLMSLQPEVAEATNNNVVVQSNTRTRFALPFKRVQTNRVVVQNQAPVVVQQAQPFIVQAAPQNVVVQAKPQYSVLVQQAPPVVFQAAPQVQYQVQQQPIIVQSQAYQQQQFQSNNGCSQIFQSQKSH